MKKWFDGFYVHRGHDIIKDEQGIYVVGYLHLFKTFNDARNFVDKIMDSTNKKRASCCWRVERRKGWLLRAANNRPQIKEAKRCVFGIIGYSHI